MSNRDISATWQYHNATRHSERSVQAGPHFLDWANQPLPYKIYTSLAPIPLPGDFPSSNVPALDAIAASGQESGGERIPNLSTLARVCFFSNGITKRWHRPSGQVFALRAAACTGALYHIELYIVCGDLPELAAGIYHYGAHDNSLRQLRAGDFRQVLVEAAAAEPAIAQAPAVIICTSTFWRNAWKYQSRAYRHTFWDDGTILANLLAIAAAVDLPTKIVLGFIDEQVNRLLDIDPQHEAAVNLVALGHTTQPPPAAPPVSPLGLPINRRRHPAARLDSPLCQGADQLRAALNHARPLAPEYPSRLPGFEQRPTQRPLLDHQRWPRTRNLRAPPPGASA